MRRRWKYTKKQVLPNWAISSLELENYIDAMACFFLVGMRRTLRVSSLCDLHTLKHFAEPLHE